MDNNRNTFVAIGLSILIIVAWQYFYVSPRMEAERRAAQIETQRVDSAKKNEQSSTSSGKESANIAVPNASGKKAPGDTNAIGENQHLTRTSALESGKRIALETPSLIGSISLKGARIDDLSLKKYRETVDPESDLIVLFSPSRTEDAYFSEFGYLGEKSVGELPGPQTEWQVESGSKLTADQALGLKWVNEKGITFRRTIALDENYMFTITDKVENGSASAITISPYGRIARFQKPVIAGIYVLHEGMIGYIGEEDGLQEYDYDDIKESKEQNFAKTDQGWLGITDKYWAAALIPTKAFDGSFAYFGTGTPHYQAHFVSDALTLQPGASETTVNRLFAGAKQTNMINQYSDDLGLFKFDFLIDWGWFYFITKPLFQLIDWLYQIVGNFGVAILITTVIVKAVFFPLANISYASMAKMKKVQPEVVALKERFADDKARQQKEMMALYKKEKINPAAGCWPMLVQIPVFFALYKVIYVTIEMRHAPFFGWIKDLAAADPTSMFNLFGLLPYDVPTVLTIGVWPLLMGITMFLQMRMNPEPSDPTQVLFFNWMPIIFTFMLASFPAGLVIYWAWNNFLSILQQGAIMKRHGVKVELWSNLAKMFSFGR